MFCVVVRLGPLLLRSGCNGREDLVVNLLGAGDAGGGLLCSRRTRLLCSLVSCVLTPGLPFRECVVLGPRLVPADGCVGRLQGCLVFCVPRRCQAFGAFTLQHSHALRPPPMPLQ